MSSDPWLWRVEYADGSGLDEYDADAPEGRGWAQVERLAVARASRIARVILIPTREGLATHVILPTAGDTPLRIFRRRRLTLDSGTGQEVSERPDPITAIEMGGGVFTFLFADGSVAVSDDLNAV